MLRHEEEYLIQRLIAMESALTHLPQKSGAVKIQDVKKEVLGSYTAAAETGTRAKLGTNPRLRPSLGAHRALRRQPLPAARNGHELNGPTTCARWSTSIAAPMTSGAWFSSSTTSRRCRSSRSPNTEEEKVTRVVSGLKDIALALEVPVHLRSSPPTGRAPEGPKRLRNHHLRGSSAMNYESDIILILNDKYHIVAKVNIEFNPYQAQRYRDWVVRLIEKNRGGQDNVNLEYEKLFEYSCFDPTGRQTAEKLIEERLYND